MESCRVAACLHALLVLNYSNVLSLIDVPFSTQTHKMLVYTFDDQNKILHYNWGL